MAHTAIIQMPVASVAIPAAQNKCQIHLGLDTNSDKPRPGCRRTKGNTDLTRGLRLAGPHRPSPFTPRGSTVSGMQTYRR